MNNVCIFCLVQFKYIKLNKNCLFRTLKNILWVKWSLGFIHFTEYFFAGFVDSSDSCLLTVCSRQLTCWQTCFWVDYFIECTINTASGGCGLISPETWVRRVCVRVCVSEITWHECLCSYLLLYSWQLLISLIVFRNEVLVRSISFFCICARFIPHWAARHLQWFILTFNY